MSLLLTVDAYTEMLDGYTDDSDNLAQTFEVAVALFDITEIDGKELERSRSMLEDVAWDFTKDARTAKVVAILNRIKRGIDVELAARDLRGESW